MSEIRVIWHGKEFMRRVERASRGALDETAAASVLVAQADLYPGHGLITGILQGSIQARAARQTRRGQLATWGSFDVNYAGPIERRYGYLRKAMDVENPKIARRIEDRL
jgi:hypothetical protein